MVKLRVRELAEARGLNMARLQIKAGVGMPSVRRYWYGTRDGSATGEPLKEVDLAVLQALAQALEVEARDLFTSDDGSIEAPMLTGAMAFSPSM
jgi:transcriptional regulator with XRE-family HTH domain